ncbi:hypothetical protein B0H16DRAFT_1605959, partial [Mycena metata]
MSLLSTLEFISTSPLSALECTRTSPLSGYDGAYALLPLGPHMGLASTCPPCAPDAPSPKSVVPPPIFDQCGIPGSSL